MSQNNVIELKKPEPFVDDPITEIIRQGARKLLAQALEAEIELFINQYADLRDELGRQRIVRNGYLPQREIQSGVGAVKVKAPRVRDRHTNPSEKIHFNSSILPPYLRKTKSIEELIPWLVFKGHIHRRFFRCAGGPGRHGRPWLFCSYYQPIKGQLAAGIPISGKSAI